MKHIHPYFILAILLIAFGNFANAQNVGIGTVNPTEKLTVDGTIRVERNSSANAPHLHLFENAFDFTRMKFSNNTTTSYFALAARPAQDSSFARFNIYNSDFGNVLTATGHGRLGVNTIPAATLHGNSIEGTDPLRIENDGNIKFSILSNNAISIGAEWDPGIANVVRVETPNMFIGFDKNHVPESRLEVDGTISSILNSNANDPHIHLYENEFDYTRMKFSNNTTTSYFALAARPAVDSSQARFNLFNSEFGNILTATGHGRLGVNVTPAAAFHTNSLVGTDAIRIMNNGNTKFRILNNNAISFGTKWDAGIANVVRFETPNMFIGYGDNHVPKERLEVDGAIRIGSAVGFPENGVIQYNPTSNEFQVYANNEWFTIDYKKDEIEIGDEIHGGIVFWLDESGEHGLVAGTNDFSSQYEWGTLSATFYEADGVGVYGGKRNTLIIIQNRNGSGRTSAAKACMNYSAGNYGDWYLPNTSEFFKLRFAASTLSNLTLTSTYYWTSNEEIDLGAGIVEAKAIWGTGTSSSILQGKTEFNKVRAIRSF